MKRLISLLIILSATTLVFSAEKRHQGSSTTDSTPSIWDTDGTFLFQSGQLNYQDSIHEDPFFVIKTNGSVHVGRNVSQEAPYTQPSIWFPNLTMMTDSNEVYNIFGTWQFIDSENYNRWAGAYITATPGASPLSSFQLVAQNTNSPVSDIILTANPTDGTDFICARVDWAPVASLSILGTWTANGFVGPHFGDGLGITNLSLAISATNDIPPADTVTIKAWANVTLPNGEVYKTPLYK